MERLSLSQDRWRRKKYRRYPDQKGVASAQFRVRTGADLGRVRVVLGNEISLGANHDSSLAAGHACGRSSHRVHHPDFRLRFFLFPVRAASLPKVTMNAESIRPRPIEQRTGETVTQAYARAWQDLAESLETIEPICWVTTSLAKQRIG